jgi:hypothetical protein
MWIPQIGIFLSSIFLLSRAGTKKTTGNCKFSKLCNLVVHMKRWLWFVSINFLMLRSMLNSSHLKFCRQHLMYWIFPLNIRIGITGAFPWWVFSWKCQTWEGKELKLWHQFNLWKIIFGTLTQYFVMCIFVAPNNLKFTFLELNVILLF